MRHVKATLAVVAAIVLNTSTLNRAFGEEVDDLDHKVTPYSCFECYSDIFGAVSPIEPDRNACNSWQATVSDCYEQCFLEGQLELDDDLKNIWSIIPLQLANNLWNLLAILCKDQWPWNHTFIRQQTKWTDKDFPFR